MPQNGHVRSDPTNRPNRPERAIAIAGLAIVLIHQPMLTIFDHGAQPPAMIFGVPVLFVYLFAAWAAVIVMTALVMESRNPPASETADWLTTAVSDSPVPAVLREHQEPIPQHPPPPRGET